MILDLIPRQTIFKGGMETHCSGRCVVALLVAAHLSVPASAAELLISVPAGARGDPQLIRFLNASSEGNIVELAAILDEGVEVDSPLTTAGTTGLMYAAAWDEVEAVKWLLSRGADHRTRDRSSGRTALIYAAAKGRISVIEALIEHGASLETRDVESDTALMYAVIGGALVSTLTPAILIHIYSPYLQVISIWAAGL